VPRPGRLIHILPALLIALVALALPFVTKTDARHVGASASVTAHAAQAEGTTGGDQRYPVGGSSINAAVATAVAYWGGQPCGGQYTMTWTPLDLGTNATSSWRNPTDAWNNPAANFDCHIDINPQADYDFPKLCTVLTHEIGHLLGHPHDPNPGQLMSAYYTTPIPQCDVADPAAPPAATTSSADEGVDIVAAPARKQTLRKKAKTKKVRRCVVRRRHHKRVKVCFKVTARKASRA